MATNKERSQAQAEEDEATLEEFLVACQKALARTVRSARQAAMADSAFGQGERPLYMIDNLDVDLSAGVRLIQGSPHGGPDRIALNFGADGAERSRLRFSVGAQAIELQTGARLELANLDPLGEGRPLAYLRVWLVNDQGLPQPDYDVDIHVARIGGRASPSVVRLRTDVVGSIEFQIDPTKNTLKPQGGGEKNASLSIKTASVYCVWASCERSTRWQVVADPRYPHPPVDPDQKADAVPRLYSEMLRLRNR